MKVYQVRKEILKRMLALGKEMDEVDVESAASDPTLVAVSALKLARLTELESLLEWVREKDGLDDA